MSKYMIVSLLKCCDAQVDLSLQRGNAVAKEVSTPVTGSFAGETLP